MGDFTQSAEELLTKLDTYREQLAQVEEALEQQPDEASLLKLRNDLTEVIVLTEDLVKYQAAAPAQDDEPAPSTQGASQGRSGHRQSIHTALIGRTCEAFYEQKWFNSEIMSVRRDERGIERCTVEFTGFQNQKEYKITDIRLLRPSHPALCQPGTKCQGIFTGDGLWYDCVVTEQTEKGYRVNFAEYGTKAELKFDQIRVGSKMGDKKRTVKEITTPGGFKVPESLVIQKTDTDEQRDLKKRKIHAIKSSQRGDKLDDEASKQQSSWQKFFHCKASIRSKTGFTTGKPKESIFKVPETLEGKVGVQGSGNGMTDFQERQKFTYQYV